MTTTRKTEDTATADNLPATTGDQLPAVNPSTALAAFQNDEWADVDDGLVGMEHIGYQLPRLVSDMRPGGGWTDETTGEKFDHLNVVWLTSAPGRAYWSEPFGKGNQAPDCRSADMVRPDEQSPNRQAATCAECPHSKWTDDGRQECSTRINTLVFDTDRQHLARVSFGVTAIKRVRAYLSGLKATVPPRPPIAVITSIKLEEIERDGMRWLEPQLTVGGQLNRSDAQPLISLRDEFLTQWRSAIAEDMAQPDSDARTESGPFDEPPVNARGAGATPNYDDEEPF